MWILRAAELDERMLSHIALRRRPNSIRMLRMVTRTGDAPSVVAALVLAFALRPGRTAALVTASTLVALALFSAVKRLCRRARPLVHALIAAPDRFSMPSGHATSAWAIAISLSVLLPVAAPLVCAWALAISWSRIVLGVHYPFDVAAGAGLGALSAIWVLAFLH